VYVHRKQGGKGLMHLEEAYTIEITILVEYVDSSEDPLLQMVRTHQNNTNSTMVQAARSLKRELQRGTRQRTA
jgi:repressor of nif and glnA expression